MDWEWSDLRYFLAVARAGTTLGGAKALGVNQTTCARRIAALERAIGVQLFVRTASGYALTTDGAALIEDAEHAEAAATSFGRHAAERQRDQKHVIRFSTSDILALLIAQPAIDSLARVRPDIRVELNVDSRSVDLVGGEADVVLRAEQSIDEPGLVVRKVLSTPWALYCSRAYADGHQVPATIAEIAEHPIATLTGRPTQILLAMCPQGDIRYSTNSMIALSDAIAKGDCVGAMPMLVGETRPDLYCCFTLDIEAAVWIAYHERLRNKAHIRAFIDHLAGFCAAWNNEQAGRHGSTRVGRPSPLA